MSETPNRESETTRKPETAPPRSETISASPRLRVAALAVRLFDFTATYMPMEPAGAEQASPIQKALLVWYARQNLSHSAVTFPTRYITRPTIMPAITASKAIVRYCGL